MQNLNHLLPPVLRGKLHLAWSTLDNDVDPSILTSTEKETYQSFKNVKRKQEFLVVRNILQYLAGQMELAPGRFTLEKDSNGKPGAEYNGRKYHISITHSKQMVLCAVTSAFPIGVDIEPAGRQINVDLRKRIMDSDEEEIVQGVNTLRIWTIKEALMKLQGKTLGSNLSDCVITNWESDIYSAKISDRLNVSVFSLNHEKHWLAVAW